MTPNTTANATIGLFELMETDKAFEFGLKLILLLGSEQVIKEQAK